MKHLFLVIFLSLNVFTLSGQTTISPELGILYFRGGDFHDLNGVLVDSRGFSTNDDPQVFFGVALKHNVVKRLNVEAKLNHSSFSISNVLFHNNQQSIFSPTKVHGLTIRSVNLELLPALELIKIGKVTLSILGGIHAGRNFISRSEEERFSDVSDELNDVYNQLPVSFDKYTASWIYGVSVDIGNFYLQYRRRTSSSYSSEMRVSNNDFDFNNNFEFKYYAMGYKISIGK